MWWAPVFVAIALLRPRLGVGPLPLAAGLAAGLALAGLAAGHAWAAIAASAAAGGGLAWYLLAQLDEAQDDATLRWALVGLGALAVGTVPGLAASIAMGSQALQRPELVEITAADLSMHHLAAWRVSEAGTTRLLAPRDVGDAWMRLKEVPGGGPDALEKVVRDIAAKRGATTMARTRGGVAGYQARVVAGDPELMLWGCEIYQAPAVVPLAPPAGALLLEYGVRRGAADPRKRIRELDGILATLQAIR